MADHPSSGAPPRGRRRIIMALRSTTIIAAITLGLFTLVEGAAGATYFAHALFFRANATMSTEEVHAEYDSLLGWTNRADANVPDLYGPGIWFRSNSQRLRATRDYPVDPPPGIARILCSGDSFALGYSVSNDSTWCALLEHRVPRVETVNMGMSGYGVDQVYLRYRRDGTQLHHDVHLFTFITDDFDRMRYSSFLGYPRPYLRWTGDTIVLANVPVPHKPRFFRARARLRDAGATLHVVGITRSILRRLGRPRPPVDRRVVPDEELQPIVRALLADVQRLSLERGSVPVVVYLPRRMDGRDLASDDWRAVVREQATSLGMPLVDLVEPFRLLTDAQTDAFFDPVLWHYTPAGNAWVAERLAEQMSTVPRVRERLEARP